MRSSIKLIFRGFRIESEIEKNTVKKGSLGQLKCKRERGCWALREHLSERRTREETDEVLISPQPVLRM